MHLKFFVSRRSFYRRCRDHRFFFLTSSFSFRSFGAVIYFGRFAIGFIWCEEQKTSQTNKKWATVWSGRIFLLFKMKIKTKWTIVQKRRRKSQLT